MYDNPLMRGGVSHFNGVRIIESAAMVDTVDDWSKARSPSRTLRRMRYNAARIRTYKPKTEALQMPWPKSSIVPTYHCFWCRCRVVGQSEWLAHGHRCKADESIFNPSK